MGSQEGVTRVLKKLEKSIEEKNYYEAHQMYHSICKRYLSQKKINEAIQLLHSGAKQMLKHEQYGSGTDLGFKLLETYEQASIACNNDSKSRLLELMMDIPVDYAQHQDFVKSCIRWSIKHGNHPLGDPQLHHVIALQYSNTGQYYDAEQHFIYGNEESVEALSQCLVNWVKISNDTGYFIARCALQLLALNKPKDASELLRLCEIWLKSQYPDFILQTIDYSGTKLSVFKSKLLNFVVLLNHVVTKNAEDLFKTCINYYLPVFEKDAFLSGLVDRIAEVYYGMGHKKPVNPFEEMVKVIHVKFMTKNLFGGPPSNQSKPQIMEVD